QAVDYFRHVFTNKLFDFESLPKMGLLCCGLLLFLEYIQRGKAHVLMFDDYKIFKSKVVRYAAYLFVVLMILTFHGSSQTFIYFQF
ncbi:MAG: hypothetical protein IJ150_00840, partial [Bacteroidales bacterium]|nr:hypothetical protein [Bacteroidales bacterium]